MSDPASNTGLFGVHGMALELRSQRMGLIASNIANAATPNYKARDIDFNTALNARIKGASQDQAAAAAVQYRVPVMPSLDGNTVETGNEQVAFSRMRWVMPPPSPSFPTMSARSSARSRENKDGRNRP